MEKKVSVGIVGTGFIATGLTSLILKSPDFCIGKILTRRDINSIQHLPINKMTNSMAELIELSDIIFECSGDAIYATEVILQASQAQKKIVTLNSEFHVTTGSYFVQQGIYITEADGDQPGCLARLKKEIEGMGFEPLAYINLKGFLNHNPTLEDMQYWSQKQQVRLEQVISFTDGTKLQIEQTLVANGLGASIVQDGMIGEQIENIYDLDFLVETAHKIGSPISDYVLVKGGSPPGILIVAKNDIADRTPEFIAFSKLLTTKKTAYVLLRNYHLCYLESLNTLRKILQGEPVLLNNSVKPRFTVGAVAKRQIQPDEMIVRGVGGFDVRGISLPLTNYRDVVPICLLQNTRVIKKIEQGQIIRCEDVSLEDTKALKIYQTIVSSLDLFV